MFVDSSDVTEDDKHFDKCCKYTAIISIAVTLGFSLYYLINY